MAVPESVQSVIEGCSGRQRGTEVLVTGPSRALWLMLVGVLVLMQLVSDAELLHVVE